MSENNADAELFRLEAIVRWLDAAEVLRKQRHKGVGPLTGQRPDRERLRLAPNVKEDQTRASKVRRVPDGYTAVTPWIISRDTVKLLEFVADAFGAEEVARVVGEDGSIGHAEFRIGDAMVMAFDAKPDWPDTPAFLRLYVADADATHRQAVAAGATSVTEVTHLFWGDRVGRVRDPLGNLWWIQSRVEEVDEAEMSRRTSDPVWLERMAYVQSSIAFPPDRTSARPSSRG